jgi:hypothetical protein
VASLAFGLSKIKEKFCFFLDCSAKISLPKNFLKHTQKTGLNLIKTYKQKEREEGMKKTKRDFLT